LNIFYKVQADPTQDQIDTIISLHNNERALVCVANIQWNTSIALMAQSYTNGCPSGHSGVQGYGENIAGGTAPVSTLVGLWINEKSGYVCGTCCSDYSALHYTQMVWSGSTQIGCGFADSTLCGYNLLICNYYPAGNFEGEEPYECGASCPGTGTGVPASSSSSSGSPPPSPITTGKLTTKSLSTSPVTSSPVTSSELTTNKILDLISDQDDKEGQGSKIAGISPGGFAGLMIVIILLLIAVIVLIILIVRKKSRNHQRLDDTPVSAKTRKTQMSSSEYPLNGSNPIYFSQPSYTTQSMNDIEITTVNFGIGSLCQAKYSQDGIYYNARIDGIQNGEDSVTYYLAYYVDFGNSEWLPKSSLRIPL